MLKRLAVVVLMLLTVPGSLLLAGDGYAQEVVMVPHIHGGYLQTTIYRPQGPGPFPVVIINHGKGMREPRDEPRYRAHFPSQEFLRHGYMVIVPMRMGFAGSSGTVKSYGCDLVKDGYAQANSIQSAVAYALERPDVKRDQLLVVGQSYGGLASVAYGALQPPANVKVIISFAGGLRKASGGCLWDQALYRAYADFGKKSRTPNLWVYTQNDEFFPTWLVQGMYQSYRDGGGPVELVTLPPYKDNGHFLFDDKEGSATWSPVIKAFLQRHQLPF